MTDALIEYFQSIPMPEEIVIFGKTLSIDPLPMESHGLCILGFGANKYLALVRGKFSRESAVATGVIDVLLPGRGGFFVYQKFNKDKKTFYDRIFCAPTSHFDHIADIKDFKEKIWNGL